MASKLVTIYYDGLCRLCSREINHYRKMKGAHALRFVDITSPDFDSAEEGVDPVRVHRTMHVKDQLGHLHLGVDAFIRIWDELPALRNVARLARKKPVHLVLEAGYAVFARIRPLLPKKSCQDSPYCEVKA